MYLLLGRKRIKNKRRTGSWAENPWSGSFYAEKVSFLLDCKIVFVTFKILFKRLKSNYGAEERPHLNIYRAYKTENTIDVKKSGNKE